MTEKREETTSRGTAEDERVVVRDKRKIDPVTGEARKPAEAPAGADAAQAPGQAPARSASNPAEPVVEAGEGPFVEASLLDERTRDLQRVQAEYANYRKRADRERLAAGELAVGRVLTELLPVLDDIDRARQHGDLTGALKAVAERLESVVSKLGLVVFGEVGDPFDPAFHEAVMHNEADDVREPTCTTVMRQGYKHGERLLRPAMVGVTDPATPAAAAPSAEAPTATAADTTPHVPEPSTDTAEPASSDDQQAGTGS